MNIEADAKSEKVTGDEKDEQLETAKETSDTKSKLEAECKPEVEKAESKKKETQVVVDKELLQACLFEISELSMFSFYFQLIKGALLIYLTLFFFPRIRLSDFLIEIELATSE